MALVDSVELTSMHEGASDKAKTPDEVIAYLEFNFYILNSTEKIGFF
jgi:hypothetical protein